MEIDRKFASVSSLTGISMLNSSSTSSTSLTASSDVRPASARLSFEETGLVIDRSRDHPLNHRDDSLASGDAAVVHNSR